jgi:hypothetical protein
LKAPETSLKESWCCHHPTLPHELLVMERERLRGEGVTRSRWRHQDSANRRSSRGFGYEATPCILYMFASRSRCVMSDTVPERLAHGGACASNLDRVKFI